MAQADQKIEYTNETYSLFHRKHMITNTTAFLYKNVQ